MTTITTSKMIMMKMTSRIYTTNPVVAIQRFQQHQLQLKQRYNSSHVRFLSSIQVHNNNNNINNQQQRRITIQKQHQNIYNNNSIYNIRSSYINNSNNNNHRRYLSSYPSHQLVGLPSLSPVRLFSSSTSFLFIFASLVFVFSFCYLTRDINVFSLLLSIYY